MKHTNEKSVSRRPVLRAAAALLAGCMMFGTAAVSAAAKETADKNTNILLIGTDHRDDSWNGNSDTMILVTIKPEQEKLIMTSFMRDLYADIPGCGVHKLNYAYAAGGAEKLEETLENNYDVTVDHYAVVDFESMAEIIDIVGGVEIEVSDAESEVLNGYLNSMNAQWDYLPGGGSYRLSGNQAVAYARIRYVGNNDYERTQRQRNILKQVFEEVHGLDAGQIASLAREVVPEIDHDYSAVEMLKLLSELPELSGYELEEQRIPYDDLFHSENEMLVPDFEATKERLHAAIGD